MKSIRAVVVLFLVFTAAAAHAETTAQAITQQIKEGCKQELNAYCKAVSPGEGRVYACLYAHSDKLSGRCEYALYETAAQLEDAVTKLTHVADSCANDLQQYCTDIKPGEGRVANCMKKNQEKLSQTCQQAMKDTGMVTK